MLLKNVPFFSLFLAFILLSMTSGEHTQCTMLHTQFPHLPLGIQDSSLHNETVENFGEKDWQQLRYLHALDQEIENNADPIESILNRTLDIEDKAWDIYRVMAHRLHKGMPEDRCQWSNLNEPASWVNMNSVILQDPIPVLHYAKKNRLL